MPLLKFNVKEGSDPTHPGVNGEKVPCPFCGAQICFIFSKQLVRGGAVVIELTELSSLMDAGVAGIGHLMPQCAQFNACMSRADAKAKEGTRAVLVALLKTGRQLPQVVGIVDMVEKPAPEGATCERPERSAMQAAISKRKPDEGIDPTTLPRCNKPAVVTVTMTRIRAETGESLPETTEHFCADCRPRRVEPPSAPSYRGISGRALAHLLCLDRLEAHVMVCTKQVRECERSATLTSAYQISLANLHPREQRRCAQLGRDMARRVARARGN